MPSVFNDFNKNLTQRERKRITLYEDDYKMIMKNVIKFDSEREIKIFLFNELTKKQPRKTVVDRLSGRLLRMESRRKHKEIKRYVK